jgi:hypothetical protein
MECCAKGASEGRPEPRPQAPQSGARSEPKANEVNKK